MSGDNSKGQPLTRKPSFKNKKPPEVRQTLTSKYRLLKANPLLLMSMATNQGDKEVLYNQPLKTLATALGNSNEILNGKLPFESTSSTATARESIPSKPSSDVKRRFEILAKPKTNFNHSNSSKIDFTTDQFLSSTVLESRRESVRKMSINGRDNSNRLLPNNRPSSSVNKGTKPEINNRPSTTKSLSNGKPVNKANQQIGKKPSTSIKILLNGKSVDKGNGESNKKPSTSTKSSLPNSKPTSVRRTSTQINKITLDKKEQNKQPQPKTLRRSLSAQHFDRKKKDEFEKFRICDAPPRKSQSFEELKIKNEKEKPNKREESNNFSTITEEGSSFNTAPETPTPKFRTPLAYERRSLKTPNTTNNRRSLFFLTPSSNDMSAKLNEWLKRRGKSLGDFRHLKCFGVHNDNTSRIVTKVVDEENKENIEASPKDDSYEDLRITVPQNIKNKDVEIVVEKEPINLEAVAKDALQDLHKLILEGYPSDQCEVWLRLIKQKYKQLEQDPQYWECRAAIEQSKGNINLAVECYKTAIVQGAEVQAVDESLDQLLQKFSLLNINSGEGNTQDRARIVQDARNIFKSSIIQFAVQERILKKKSKEGVTVEKKLIATPVRRSTRLSRSAYTSTPGVTIYSSLQDVDDNIRESICFRHNKALN